MNASPETSPPDPQNFHVDGWLVQPRLNRLVRGERAIHVRPQLVDLLACLAQKPGAVVSRDQLLATVWSDRHICESGVARCIAELRQILADDARQPRIIETIPKRGYRLIAPVEHADSVAAPLTSAGTVCTATPVLAGALGRFARGWLSAAVGLFAAWRN